MAAYRDDDLNNNTEDLLKDCTDLDFMNQSEGKESLSSVFVGGLLWQLASTGNGFTSLKKLKVVKSVNERQADPLPDIFKCRRLSGPIFVFIADYKCSSEIQRHLVKRASETDLWNRENLAFDPKTPKSLATENQVGVTD